MMSPGRVVLRDMVYSWESDSVGAWEGGRAGLTIVPPGREWATLAAKYAPLI